MTYQPVPAPILTAHHLEHVALRRAGMSGLGADVELGMQSRDPILRGASVWAARMMDWARSMPPERRGPELKAAANRISPGLGDRAERIGTRLMDERHMMPDKALHRGLQYAFADSLVKSVLELGADARAGRPPNPRNMMVATPPAAAALRGLGQTTAPARTPEQVTGDIIGGIVCADGVASLVGHAAGVNDTKNSASDRQLAAGLTELGFVIARGVSGAVGHGCPPGTTPVPPPPPVVPEPTTPPWLIPAAIAGTVVVVGVVLVIALK